MIDATRKFRPFKESIPREEGSPPKVPIPNIKTIVIKYLNYKFKQLDLKDDVQIHPDHSPLVQMFQELQSGGRNALMKKRFVSVVQLSSTVNTAAVGQVIKSKEVMDALGLDRTQYGWVERVELEVVYWSINPVDRDHVGDLVKLYMLEMHRNGYLLRNGVFAFNFRTAYDGAEERVNENTMVFNRVMHFDFMHFFFGTETLGDENNVLIDGIEISPTVTFPDDTVDTSLGPLDWDADVDVGSTNTAPASGPMMTGSDILLDVDRSAGPEPEDSC